MAKGAGVAIISKSGETALALAQSRGHEPIIRLLRGSGNVNANFISVILETQFVMFLRIRGILHNPRFYVMYD